MPNLASLTYVSNQVNDVALLFQTPEQRLNARKRPQYLLPESSARHQSRAAEDRDQPREGGAHLKPGTTMMCSLFLVVVLGVLIGCGAGHSNLTSITVSPQSAKTTSSPQAQVGYTATGNFANGKSRELSQVDGLSWKTSPTSAGTVAATIGSTGEATCSALGNVTITASAPQNLQLNVNNGSAEHILLP